MIDVKWPTYYTTVQDTTLYWWAICMDEKHLINNLVGELNLDRLSLSLAYWSLKDLSVTFVWWITTKQIILWAKQPDISSYWAITVSKISLNIAIKEGHLTWNRWRSLEIFQGGSEIFQGKQKFQNLQFSI